MAAADISAGSAARRLFFGWRRRQTIPAGGSGASRRLRGLPIHA